MFMESTEILWQKYSSSSIIISDSLLDFFYDSKNIYFMI